MDNLKCLFDHVSAHSSVDFIDARETLRKKLKLVVRLDESNKKNEYLKNQISSQDEKMFSYLNNYKMK